VATIVGESELRPPHARKRYQEIAHVLARYGFDWLWTEPHFASIFGPLVKPAKSAHTKPENLRLMLEELGTTFIKLGQALSTRPDLIPPEYVAELSKLQDHVPELPYSDIETTIEKEFGKAPNKLFHYFHRKPLGAGSIGQVHKATLHNGTHVVVKVRRPGIEQQVEQDLVILGQIARILSANENISKQYDFEGFVDEFAHTIRNEMDFMREGQNAERIAKQFEDDPTFHVPAIFWHYSSHVVLTMEAVDGIKIDDFAALDAAKIDRHQLAENCANIALVQVLENGFFHADPHPGNFFVQPDGSVTLLDYGMVGRIDDRLRATLLRLAMAVTDHDTDRIVDELLSLGAANDSIDRAKLSRDIEEMLDRYQDVPIGKISVAKLLREVSAIAQRHGLKLPSELIVLVRVVAMDEGLGASLDPGFNFLEFSEPYFKKFFIKSQFQRMAKGLKNSVIDLAELPDRVKRFSEMLERGEVTVKSRIEVPEPLMKRTERVANRIAVSVLAAGALIAFSAVLNLAGAAKPRRRNP